MEFIGNPVELVRRYHAFVYGPSVPEAAAEKLQTIPGTAADIISQGAEILYAHRDLLPSEGLLVLGQLTAYGVAQGWSGLNEGGRWEKISQGVRRDLGEKGDFQPAAEDPEPRLYLREGGIDWRAPEPEKE